MPCTAWAVKGGTRCYFHANPEKVSELGRRGGEAKGPGGARYAERSLKTVDDVTALLGDTIKDLGMGLIDPKEATAVGYLAAGMLKALQQGDIESRLRALEAKQFPFACDSLRTGGKRRGRLTSFVVSWRFSNSYQFAGFPG
jgi:hypothetical protein